MRSEPDSGASPVVNDDVPPDELPRDPVRVRNVHSHSASAPLRIEWRANRESAAFRLADQQSSLAHRFPANVVYSRAGDNSGPDLRGCKGGNRGGAVKEFSRAFGVAHGGLKRERMAVGEPPGDRRLQLPPKRRTHPEERRAGSAAQPFQDSSNQDIDAQLPDIDRDDPDGMIGVEDDERSA